MKLPPSRLPSRRPGAAGFTLVEIAIALAVIGFALLAVVGLLQVGFRIQAENREEGNTNIDGNYLLEAIRNGAEGIDDLVDYVDSLNDQPLPAGTTSYDIIGTLSTPGTNRMVIRSISGPAVQRKTDMPSLRYDVTVVIVPTIAGDQVSPPVQAVLANNLYDVRLLYRWPVLPNGALLTNSLSRRVFRTQIAGQPVTNIVNGQNRVFFRSQEFRRP